MSFTVNDERLGDTITGYLKALGQLEKAISQPKDEYVRDSVIQRFEFIHELALKMLKLRLEQEYVFANTPRETMRASLQAGFIEDGNAWTDLQKMRNLTSHTYNEELAEEVYAFVVGEGVYLFQQLAQKTLLWKTND